MQKQLPIAFFQPTMPVVSIIICVSNGTNLLLECLRSLEAFGPKDIAFETIVVLNDLSDEDQHELRNATSGVKIVSSPVNLGLAGGSNLGREYASGQYIVLLHDDAKVEAGWLEALVQAAIVHPQAGIVGGKSVYPDRRFQNAGMAMWRDGTSSWLLADMPSADENSPPIPVDFCGSSSLLIRMKLWDKIGGLDENYYPAYYVDADLAMAARQHGYIVLCEAKSRIQHHQTASSSSRFRMFLIDYNQKYFINKWRNALENHCTLDPDDIEASLHRSLARVFLPLSKMDCTDNVTHTPIDKSKQQENHRRKYQIIKSSYESYLIEHLEEAEAAQVYIPIYHLNTPATFYRGGNGFKYLVSGDYHDPDIWGSWIRSTKARLILALEDRALDQAETVRLVVETFHFINHHRQTSPFRLSVNGVSMIAIDEMRSRIQKYRVMVPSIIFKATRCLLICIETADPIDHKLESQSKSWPLSVGLRSLRIDLT